VGVLLLELLGIFLGSAQSFFVYGFCHIKVPHQHGLSH
jgi:hypothetical protein